VTTPEPHGIPATDAKGRATGTWANAGIGRIAAPLRDQVLNVVRQAILDFQLVPGQRLVERELIEQLDVSRTTVREVLASLTTEGLVTMVPQKGAIVSVLSPEEAADIYEMRVALEALAVQRFIERASPEQFDQLADSLGYVEAAARKPAHPLDELRAKDRFYEVLLAGAGSVPLTQMLSMLQGRVRALRAMSLSAPGRPVQAAEEIRQVVEAILARDTRRATAACKKHVRNAAKVGLARRASITDLSG
jgi:DNA-binding GntR family transcriptional regulator